MPEAAQADPRAVVAFLDHRFCERPDDPAVVSPAGSCTFSDLINLCHNWEGELAHNGIGRGTVACLIGDFSPNAAALFLSLAAAGAIVIPQRRGARPAERRRQDELAQAEMRIEIDEADNVDIEPTGRTADHRLYSALRQRDRPGLVGFSSATSGEPKAAVHDLVPWLDTFRPRRRTRSTLAFLLFDHLGGLRTMLYALSNGAKVIAVPDRHPETVCAAIESERIQLLPATPTFFNLLLLSGAHRKYDMGSLRTISYGAEPMPPKTLRRLRLAFPNVTLQQTYGLIELGPLRTSSRDDHSLWVKVGGEGVGTRVVDGRLQVRSPASILGYLNAPSPITADGWFDTGDAVEQDGDYVRFLGRESELINVGGEKVYPAEVEGVIEAMDGIAMATVHGEPNTLVGQIVCAAVKPAAGVTPPDLARRVKRHCREHLERYKVPVKVALMQEAPVTDRLKKRRGGR